MNKTSHLTLTVLLIVLIYSSSTGQIESTSQDLIKRTNAHLESTSRVADLYGHTEPIKVFAISKDEKTIATGGGRDKKVVIWDNESGEVLNVLPQKDQVDMLQFGFDARYLLSAVAENGVKIWDLESNKLIGEYGEKMGDIYRAVGGSFLNEGKHVMIFSLGRPVQIWDVQKAVLLRSFDPGTKNARDPVFNADRTKFLAKILDHKLILVNIEDGRVLRTFDNFVLKLDSYGFSKDESKIITTSWDKTAKIWDLNTCELLVNLEGHQQYVHEAEINPNGETVITSSSDRTAKLWNAKTGNVIHTFGPFGPSTVFGRTRFCKFTADGSQVIISTWGGGKGVLQLWNIEPLELIHDFAEESYGSTQVDFNTGQTFLFNINRTKMNKWSMETGKLLQVYE